MTKKKTLAQLWARMRENNALEIADKRPPCRIMAEMAKTNDIVGLCHRVVAKGEFQAEFLRTFAEHPERTIEQTVIDFDEHLVL